MLQFLVSLPKSLPNPAAYAFALLDIRQGCPMMVRHYGLHMLDTLVTAEWNSLHWETKAFIRETLENAPNFLQGGTVIPGSGKGDVEINVILEKTAKIVVEVCKREWPHRWRNFNRCMHAWWDSMVGICQNL